MDFIVSEDYNRNSIGVMDEHLEQYLFEPGQFFKCTSPLLFVMQLGLGGGLQLPLQLHLNHHKSKNNIYNIWMTLDRARV